MKRISVVVPCGGGFPERVRNLEAMLDCLESQTFHDFQLILVEQSLDSSFYHDDKHCDRYIQLQDPLQRGFNLSWGRNVGARASDGDILLLMDADYVFPAHYLEEVAKMDAPFFSGGNWFIWSSPEAVQVYLRADNLSVFSACSRVRPFIQNFACGGVVGFDRNWFEERFVGYCENFFQYGFEELEAFDRIKKLQRIDDPAAFPTVACPLVHMHHHHREVPAGTNCGLFQKITQLPADYICRQLGEVNVGNVRQPALIEVDRQ